MSDSYRPGQPARRLSYASVASGAASHSIPRTGYLAHLGSTPPSNQYPLSYPQELRQQRRSSNYEQDHGAGANSYKKPLSLPSYSRRFNTVTRLSGYSGSLPFFVPEYLRESRHVAKLEAEYMTRAKQQRQQPSSPASNAASLSSSANINVHRLAPSHRGMTYDVIESNPPKDDEELMPLPSRWSDQDKSPGLDISNDGLDVKYSGVTTKAEIEAASVRADFPMSPACGLYYFEVTLHSKSKDTAIAIGFSTAEASLERLPGWEIHSWGYHGDDGKMFFGEQTGRPYGPTFSTNDVVGCGVDFNLGQAFFTVNGRELDTCFRDLKDVRLFPTVGMKKWSGASVSVNFGQQAFVFDIAGKMKTFREAVQADIAKAKTGALRQGLSEDSLIQQLVAQYLAHDGYVETAQAFTEELAKEREALSNTNKASTAVQSTSEETEAVFRQRKPLNHSQEPNANV
jgi:Ran-binding protein 9/10